MKKEQSRLTATIFITDRCNLACKYCYETNKQFQDNTKENIKKFIDHILTSETYNKFDFVVFDYIGGEALIKYDLIKFAIDYTKYRLHDYHHRWEPNCKHAFYTCSNGTLFNNPEIKKFLEDYPELQVGLSLDGCKTAHDINRVYLNGNGSFDDIMAGFSWWRNKYNDNSVKGTFNKETLPYVADSLIFQSEIGLKPWCNWVFEEDWTEKDAELYYNQLTKFVDWLFETKQELNIIVPFRTHKIGSNNLGCGTLSHMITLGLDGKLYPCHRFACDKKFSIGDLENGYSYYDMAYFINHCISRNLKDTCANCFATEYKDSFRLMSEVEEKAYKYYIDKLKEEGRKNVFTNR